VSRFFRVLRSTPWAQLWTALFHILPKVPITQRRALRRTGPEQKNISINSPTNELDPILLKAAQYRIYDDGIVITEVRESRARDRNAF